MRYRKIVLRVPEVFLPHLDRFMEHEGVYGSRADCILATIEAEAIPDEAEHERYLIESGRNNYRGRSARVKELRMMLKNPPGGMSEQSLLDAGISQQDIDAVKTKFRDNWSEVYRYKKVLRRRSRFLGKLHRVP